MVYKALKCCKFDRKYSVGERIDGSVIDPQCLPRAVKFGCIVLVEEESIPFSDIEPVEAVEAAQTVSPVEDKETVVPKRRGRRKGNEAV